LRDRNHVGELRPSQLMHTYGVGAIVELPEMTTLVLGLDDWPHILGEPVSEPRLLAAVREATGSQVEQLLTPPVVPDGDRRSTTASSGSTQTRTDRSEPRLCTRVAPAATAAARRRRSPRDT